ncbi:auxin response factor 16-like [Bidens hawaiensis]|uniref:auxin response factor 16-like n=1 Tax=Bidens hawaiensis TaxID=980011 RepID=UPI004049AC15
MVNVTSPSNNEVSKCLWRACAGAMVQMPTLNSKVFYFPQGHAEHAASGNVDFKDFPKIPPYILCRVSAVTFLADPDTDEVYAKMGLIPLKNDNGFDSNDAGVDQNKDKNPTSFAKTLTQSDANNGGGFSVPRYCADTIFPRLDYTADPPVQNITAKDVHGQVWKFRHIYRGTPRRHLLTTGWSPFVNKKKLVAGDSIVFLRAENGDLCVGIRRANRGVNNGNRNKLFMNPGGRFTCESVLEAVNLAAKGEAFEVFYHPRSNAPQFCVKAESVIGAMRTEWSPRMRFRMAFETQDSSRISWIVGTVALANAIDNVHWPSSPWRSLQVSWDEPDLVQNVMRVNPWSVEVVSNMSAIHISPVRKKARFPQPPEFTNNYIPTSIQGARHNNNTNDSQINKILSGIKSHEPLTPTIKKTSKQTDGGKNGAKKKPVFMLFGQPILTEQQLFESSSGDDDDDDDDDNDDDDGSVVLHNGSVESSSEEGGPCLDEPNKTSLLMDS